MQHAKSIFVVCTRTEHFASEKQLGSSSLGEPNAPSPGSYYLNILLNIVEVGSIDPSFHVTLPSSPAQ